MTSQIGDISEDGFWVLTENGWLPTEQQNQALAVGAAPHNQTEESAPSFQQV